MAPAVGFEPTTNGLTVRCATAAPRRNTQARPCGAAGERPAGSGGIYHGCSPGCKARCRHPMGRRRTPVALRGGALLWSARRREAACPAASWRSGYAEDCKSLYAGSIPADASISPGGDLMIDFAQARRMMVDSQLRTFDVNDIPVLDAFDSVPRERFVPEGRESLAYIDQDLLVGAGSVRRFMLSPMILARMIQTLAVGPGTRVLDVAAGRGYASAVLATLGARVTALESDPELAGAARADAPVPRLRGRGGGGAARRRGAAGRAVRGDPGQRRRRGQAGRVARTSSPRAAASSACRGAAVPPRRRSMSAPAMPSEAATVFDAAAPSLAEFARDAGLRLLNAARGVAFLRHPLPNRGERSPTVIVDS